ncbi:MAG: hypothetical protein Q8927_05755 [Bacteroidota bacterium]|nr:hypothetical protein [Bacteroidota bacterium]MDP4215687.1 hypothetical protein [Bacteroidota bacterium]MDP4247157.1 hypothetical protein [Bacteroidota bacterium]MDP4255307.1 hypothetical protein [Bacteroidota bacterium]MDP4260811.1 hypothetical protein [Bacteroidota bacterium]
MEDLFLKLSAILTGFDDLDPKLGSLYYKELMKASGPPFTALLQTFSSKVLGHAASTGHPASADQPAPAGNPEDLLRENIWNVMDFQILSQAIINLWYTATLKLGNVTWVAPPEAYFDSLLWRAIEAHPPAVSGGYFGYWRYPPEN